MIFIDFNSGNCQNLVYMDIQLQFHAFFIGKNQIMNVGVLDWFNIDKGFGVLKIMNDAFLIDDENQKNGIIRTLTLTDVFFHISNWKDCQEFRSNEELLFFDIGMKQGKASALNCVYFNYDNQEHWKTIFSISSLPQKTFNSIVSVLNNLTNYSVIIPVFNEILNETKNKDFNQNYLIFKIYNEIQNEELKTIVQNLISKRINNLSNQEIIKFWKDEIIADFQPKQSALIEVIKNQSKEDLLCFFKF